MGAFQIKRTASLIMERQDLEGLVKSVDDISYLVDRLQNVISSTNTEHAWSDDDFFLDWFEDGGQIKIAVTHHDVNDELTVANVVMDANNWLNVSPFSADSLGSGPFSEEERKSISEQALSAATALEALAKKMREGATKILPT